jgi:hypothetical protein
MNNGFMKPGSKSMERVKSSYFGYNNKKSIEEIKNERDVDGPSI